MNNILMDNVINIINESKSLVLEVKNNLIINIFNENDIKMDINIIQHNNSILKINYLSINKEDSNILINVLIKGNNNKCDINYHVISENGYSKSKVCVKANKNTFGNVITENLKGLKEGGNILIEPILEIDTNEVAAPFGYKKSRSF